MYEFKTAKELLHLCAKHKRRVSEMTVLYEMEYSGSPRGEVLSRMRRNKVIMREAVKAA